VSRCPRCNSPKPHLHPAMQVGGEVQICTDVFHRTVTSENTQARIDEVFGIDARYSHDRR